MMHFFMFADFLFFYEGIQKGCNIEFQIGLMR